MPFEVRKVEGGYKLYKLKEKEFAKPLFKTRQSAINQGRNYMRYRHEKSVVKGNKILKKK